MSWLDQFNLNALPQDLTAQPGWDSSVLAAATAEELAQAQAELDSWANMSFSGEDALGVNHDSSLKDSFGAGYPHDFGWQGEHDGFAPRLESHNHSALGLYSHASTADFSSWSAGIDAPANSLNNTPTTQIPSPHTVAPSNTRKRSRSAASPPSPPPSDTASGRSASISIEQEDRKEHVGPLSEVDKRKRNTEASARFRAKKRQREQELRQSTSVLQDKVTALEKAAEAVSPLCYILRVPF